MFATNSHHHQGTRPLVVYHVLYVQNKCKFRPCVKFHYLGLHRAFYILWRMLWKKEM
nr:MAG TPA_asm: hypothetical protein [Caudoviricetes sp.]